MCILPKPDQLVEMLRSNTQDVFDIAAAGVAGAHGVASLRPPNLATRHDSQFDHNLNPRIEAMDMTGLMIFRKRNKANAFES